MIYKESVNKVLNFFDKVGIKKFRLYKGGDLSLEEIGQEFCKGLENNVFYYSKGGCLTAIQTIKLLDYIENELFIKSDNKYEKSKTLIKVLRGNLLMFSNRITFNEIMETSEYLDAKAIYREDFLL